MKNISPEAAEALEKFNLNFKQRVPVIIIYFFIMLILRAEFSIPFPYLAFALLIFMLFFSSALAFYLNNSIVEFKTIAKFNFAYIFFDLLVLTAVIYYLGGASWVGFIFYSFYLIIVFMTLPYLMALLLSCWNIFLYLALASLQYLGILYIWPLFPAEKQNYLNPTYVLTTTIAFVSTFMLVAYYSRGFYLLHLKKVLELEQIKEILEKERNSLASRVEEKKEELRTEKENLRLKIKKREKELQSRGEELQKRVRELEQFQRITSGREAKAGELEKEIDNLKKVRTKNKIKGQEAIGN